jgi:hypothetical protein
MALLIQRRPPFFSYSGFQKRRGIKSAFFCGYLIIRHFCRHTKESNDAWGFAEAPKINLVLFINF